MKGDQRMDYTRLRRGMIFWKPGCTVERSIGYISEDKSYPWIIVSNDSRNVNHYITIIPILRMKKVPNITTNYIQIVFHNEPAYVMCDIIQTVNAYSLESSQYDGWIEDSVMNKIADKLRKSLFIEYTAEDIMSTPVAERIESVIDQIIQNKLREATKSIPQEEVDDLALKVSTTIEDLFDLKIDDKKVSTTFDIHSSIENEDTSCQLDNTQEYEEKSKPKVKPRSKNVWTEDNIIEFLHRYDTEDHEQLIKEYHFKNIKSMQQTRRQLARKLD